MIHKLLTVLLVTAMLTIATAPVYAADELFDTSAAAKHLEKGISLLKSRNIDAAVREFEESAEISPEAETFYYLGYAYYLQGRAGNETSRKLALENFEKAYEIDPNFTPTRLPSAEAAASRPAQAPASAADQTKP